MDKPRHIEDNDFAQVIRNSALVSIDIIISDDEGNVLVGLRANEPARGYYFVPGGIIRKNETISDAFERILKKEIAWSVGISDAIFFGVFEHFYRTNRFDSPDYGTHYVVLAYQLKVPTGLTVKLDSQHSEIKWIPKTEIISAPNVHPNTKVYFS